MKENVIQVKSYEFAKDIINFCKGKIASYKVPRKIIFVSEFPVTTSGKIRKYELKKMIS